MTHRDRSAVSRSSCMNSMWGSPISGSPGYGQPSGPTDPVYRLEPQQPAPSHQQCRPDLGKSRDLAVTNNALLKWNIELYLQTTLLKEDRSLGWGQSKNCMWLSLRSLQVSASVLYRDPETNTRLMKEWYTEPCWMLRLHLYCLLHVSFINKTWRDAPQPNPAF